MRLTDDIKLVLSVAPAATAVFAAEAGHHTAFQLPTPFLSIFACVTFAGAINGRLSGTIAGMLAGLYVGHGYIDGFGPQKLTGGLVQTTIGITLYMGTGYLIGLIRDQRDTSAARLLDIEHEHTAAEKAAMQKALDHNEALFEQALNVAGIGLWVWDIKEDRCEYSTELGSKMYDYTPEEFIEITSASEFGLGLIHPDSRDAYLAVCEQVKQGSTVNHDYKGLKANGDTIYVHEALAPIRDGDGQVVKMIGTAINITDQRQTEMQLRQAQKMEAVGQLTAGISHDFNNLLAVILGNLELIKMKVDDPGIRENADLALAATDRGAKLTQQLLAYSRQITMDKVILDPNRLIRDMDDLLRRSLPATIQVETVLSAGLWPIEVDRTQFESAVLNLAINARDAQAGGGKITIETSNIRLDDNYCAEHGLKIGPGRYVLIAVSDTGTGMSPATLEHAMDSFFTTKPTGEGSGLGLAMVCGFMKQTGGHISIHSEPDHGTTVKLYFPEACDVAQLEELPPFKPEVRSADAACILLVEDDQDVRAVVAAQLRQLGFGILEAQDAKTGLSMLRS
ncbi:MAG: ATP-binding protein, partial [Hyphomicrobiales bacterium]|nr:ATP-binding protein [Hyphomicrobiales bacterium]